MVDLWDTQMDIPWALQMEAGAVEMMEYLLVDWLDLMAPTMVYRLENLMAQKRDCEKVEWSVNMMVEMWEFLMGVRMVVWSVDKMVVSLVSDWVAYLAFDMAAW